MSMPILSLGSSRNKIIVVLGIFSVALMGSMLIAKPHALTPAMNIETETGTLVGCLTRVTDDSASMNFAIRFNTCSGNNNMTNPTNLDSAGNAILDTNYAIPAGAIFMATTGDDSNVGTEFSPVM